MTASLGLPLITIDGREFRVAKDGDVYELTGARGAKYRTIRNRIKPSRMYLYNAKDWAKAAPQVWLTDENGMLEVLLCRETLTQKNGSGGAVRPRSPGREISS